MGDSFPFWVWLLKGNVGRRGVNGRVRGWLKETRMMETNPYFAVSSGSSGFQTHGYGSGYHSSTFPVVRLRGLPFNCTDLDIFKFFVGLDIVDALLVNKNGRFSGEAFVVLASSLQAELALQRDKQTMGRRYVEIFRYKASFIFWFYILLFRVNFSLT